MFMRDLKRLIEELPSPPLVVELEDGEEPHGFTPEEAKRAMEAVWARDELLRQIELAIKQPLVTLPEAGHYVNTVEGGLVVDLELYASYQEAAKVASERTIDPAECPAGTVVATVDGPLAVSVSDGNGGVVFMLVAHPAL
jgi:hypothetical protein